MTKKVKEVNTEAEVKKEKPVAPKAKFATVSTPLNLRADASTNAAVVRVMPKDERVQVLNVNGDWAKLKDGFCMVKYLVMD